MTEFHKMYERQLRRWVEANSDRVNDKDAGGCTPLVAAVLKFKSAPLSMWLLDEKCADVNATTAYGNTALHYADSLDILTASLDRGADPTMADHEDRILFMGHAASGLVDTVAHLLQDQRVHATVDVQGRDGETALHHACTGFVAEAAAIKVHLLLQAGADSLVTDKYGLTPLTWTREVRPFTAHHFRPLGRGLGRQ